MDIQDRIINLIKALELNVNSFAVKLGVPNATITHIVKGNKEGRRNAPGHNMMVRICETFPQVNLDWLVLGVGDMFRDAPITLPAKQDLQIVMPNDETVRGLLSQIDEYKKREDFLLRQNTDLSACVAQLSK